MTTLQNKTAIVTGASSGLGKAVVELLHQKGVKVFALARSVQDVDLPDGVVKVPMNIRGLDDIDKAFAAIDAQANQIDILVNCAGRALTKGLEHTTRDEIMDVFGVNLKGNIYIAQEAYRRMQAHRAGHIVNVGSTSGIKARADEPIYAASKWGLRGFTESLRLAAVTHGIRVTGVYPGGMQTAFWNGEPGKDTSGFMKPEDVAATIVGMLETPSSIAPSELIIERGLGA